MWKISLYLLWKVACGTHHKKLGKWMRGMAWNLEKMNVELKHMWLNSLNVTKHLEALTSLKQIFTIHREFKTTTIINNFTRTSDVLTKGGLIQIFYNDYILFNYYLCNELGGSMGWPFAHTFFHSWLLNICIEVLFANNNIIP